MLSDFIGVNRDISRFSGICCAMISVFRIGFETLSNHVWDTKMQETNINKYEVSERINRAQNELQILKSKVGEIDRFIAELDADRTNALAVVEYVSQHEKRADLLKRMFRDVGAYPDLSPLIPDENTAAFQARADKRTDQIAKREAEKKSIEEQIAFINADIELLKKIMALNEQPYISDARC